MQLHVIPRTTREILERDCVESEAFVQDRQHQTRETLSLYDAVVDSWIFFFGQVASCSSLADLKHHLRWDKSVDGQDTTTPWIDHSGISLIYAAMVNQVELVRKVLKLYDDRKLSLLSGDFQRRCSRDRHSDRTSRYNR